MNSGTMPNLGICRMLKTCRQGTPFWKFLIRHRGEHSRDHPCRMKKQPLTSLGMQLGSWAEYLRAYTTLIKERGYSLASGKDQTQLITRFIQCLRRRHTEIHLLDTDPLVSTGPYGWYDSAMVLKSATCAHGCLAPRIGITVWPIRTGRPTSLSFATGIRQPHQFLRQNRTVMAKGQISVSRPG
jgi:hypothetical protein